MLYDLIDEAVLTAITILVVFYAKGVMIKEFTRLFWLVRFMIAKLLQLVRFAIANLLWMTKFAVTNLLLMLRFAIANLLWMLRFTIVVVTKMWEVIKMIVCRFIEKVTPMSAKMWNNGCRFLISAIERVMPNDVVLNEACEGSSDEVVVRSSDEVITDTENIESLLNVHVEITPLVRICFDGDKTSGDAESPETHINNTANVGELSEKLIDNLTIAVESSANLDSLDDLHLKSWSPLVSSSITYNITATTMESSEIFEIIVNLTVTFEGNYYFAIPVDNVSDYLQCEFNLWHVPRLAWGVAMRYDLDRNKVRVLSYINDYKGYYRGQRMTTTDTKIVFIPLCDMKVIDFYNRSYSDNHNIPALLSDMNEARKQLANKSYNSPIHSTPHARGGGGLSNVLYNDFQPRPLTKTTDKDHEEILTLMPTTEWLPRTKLAVTESAVAGHGHPTKWLPKTECLPETKTAVAESAVAESAVASQVLLPKTKLAVTESAVAGHGHPTKWLPKTKANKLSTKRVLK